MSANYDAIVIGGGMLGSAIGYGLARLGINTAILDEGDVAYRAARGNFGLVWVQGKGSNAPSYANWTRHSAELWPRLSDALRDAIGHNVQLRQNGGVHICLSEAEFEARKSKMEDLAAHQGNRFQYEMLGRNALASLLPELGPDVVGGSYSPQDGHADPLRTLAALHAAFRMHGGKFLQDHRVNSIEQSGDGFRLQTRNGAMTANRVVLAAGLGNRDLAPMVGLAQPLHPIKGQVLVTERTHPFLDIATTQVRQTGAGTIMIGDSHEDVGFDTTSTTREIGSIAARAMRMFPSLEQTNVVRSWAALRVMSPDGLPVYDQSPSMPGAYAVSCHSGVTLAAAHAFTLANDIANAALPNMLKPLGQERFDVQAA